MKRLTLRQTLIKCRDMWRWLASHPRCNKSVYLDSIKLPRSERPESDCWFCEYCSRLDISNPPEFDLCGHCPGIKGKLWTDCTSRMSIYTAWCDNVDSYDEDDQETAREAALKIANFCDRLLKTKKYKQLQNRG